MNFDGVKSCNPNFYTKLGFVFDSKFGTFSSKFNIGLYMYPEMTKDCFLEVLYLPKIIFMYFWASFGELKKNFFQDFLGVIPSISKVMIYGDPSLSHIDVKKLLFQISKEK